MSRQILFIEGGGEGGHEADEALVTSLKENLGKGYQVDYPEIQSDETASDFGWTKQIGEKISKADGLGFVIPYACRIQDFRLFTFQ